MMTASQAGWIGVWVLIGSSAVILVELAIASVWSVRLARRSQAVVTALQTERGLIDADVVRLRAAMDETRRLWEPYRRALRWLRHPLVVALIGFYRRRLF